MSAAVAISGVALDRAEVPVLPVEEFRGVVIEAAARELRVASLFALGERELVAVLADDPPGRLEVCACRLDGDGFRSMTPECPQVHLFEREICEQSGLRPLGHPWLKP